MLAFKASLFSTTKNLYNNARSHGIGLSVQEKYAEAKQKIANLTRDRDALKSQIQKFRWKWALERVTNGTLLLSFDRTSSRMLLRVFKTLKGERVIGWRKPHTNVNYAENTKKRLQKYKRRDYRIEKKEKAIIKARWRYAVERITNGSTLLSFDRTSFTILKKVFKFLNGEKSIGWRAEYKDINLSVSMKASIEQHKHECSSVDGEILALKPYSTLLENAITFGGADLSAAVCEQSGFQGLIDLEEGRKPNCCVCLQPLEEPTVTRCVHLACGKCIITWLEASSVLSKTQNRDCAPCPLCRQEFSLSTLIRVIPGEKNAPLKCLPVAKTSTPDTSGEILRKTPEICPAIEEEMYKDIPANKIGVREGRFPALSRYLVFMSHAQMTRTDTFLSEKEKVILKFLEKEPKLVIFSQFASSLKYLSQHLLSKHNIGHRIISQLMNKKQNADAIGQFNEDPECKCFLLQASSAAAGLTLTVAKTCILLEPFLKEGDESQAINRIHRIGQTEPVKCFTLYTHGTIEERILAWRQQNDTGEGSNQDLLAVLPEDQETNHDSTTRLMTFFGVNFCDLT